MCLLLVLVLGLHSQEEQRRAETPKRKLFGFRALADSISEEKNGVFILPLLYYTPDTRWAFGAAGVYYFKLPARSESEHETRISNVQFLADYTQNRQLDLWGQWNIFTVNENYLFKGEARYRNFPDRFYGIGNRTNKKQEELYEYSLLSFKSLVLKKIYPGVFAGADYHLEKEYGFKYFNPKGLLGSGQVPGFGGSIGSALGLVVIYDNRDNVINTYKGRLAEISSYFYTPSLGSTFRFTYFNAVYQQFWQIKKKHILAWQSKLRYGFGNVPFLDMSTLGNDDLLRGYPKNRFRDLSFAATQLEYRFPLWWRFGMVVFG